MFLSQIFFLLFSFFNWAEDIYPKQPNQENYTNKNLAFSYQVCTEKLKADYFLIQNNTSSTGLFFNEVPNIENYCEMNHKKIAFMSDSFHTCHLKRVQQLLQFFKNPKELSVRDYKSFDIYFVPTNFCYEYTIYNKKNQTHHPNKNKAIYLPKHNQTAVLFFKWIF